MIRKGRLKVGYKIPTAPDLSRQSDSNRMTVRKVIDPLVLKGLIIDIFLRIHQNNLCSISDAPKHSVVYLNARSVSKVLHVNRTVAKKFAELQTYSEIPESISGINASNP